MIAHPPEAVQQRGIPDIMNWYNNLCRKDEGTGHWVVPATGDLLSVRPPYITQYDWPLMLHDERLRRGDRNLVGIVPTYFRDEADPNRFDRPRLDFVVTYDDGERLRYHPGASVDPADVNNAAVTRRNRQANLRWKYNRDWER